MNVYDRWSRIQVELEVNEQIPFEVIYERECFISKKKKVPILLINSE